jgi:hypothetical protein
MEHYFLNDELNLTLFEVICLNTWNTTRMSFRIFFVSFNVVGTGILSLPLNENVISQMVDKVQQRFEMIKNN